MVLLLQQSGGFFSNWFGGKSSTVDYSCEKKNCELKEYIKDQIASSKPPLLQRCEDAPGFCAPKCKKSCLKPEPKEEPKGCESESKDRKECAPKPGKGCGCTQEIQKVGQCPPMPCSECDNCKPPWVTSITKQKKYAGPEGIEIKPISFGGRNSADGKCNNTCSASKSDGCPMNQPKPCAVKSSAGGSPKGIGGFFLRASSIIKSSSYEDEYKSEDLMGDYEDEQEGFGFLDGNAKAKRRRKYKGGMSLEEYQDYTWD